MKTQVHFFPFVFAALVLQSPLKKFQSFPLDYGLAQTPRMGWNSSNKFGCVVDEKLINSNPWPLSRHDQD
ncbi:MAG: hypothetical protein DMF74_08925 [Acidobacteria bacterium]|nr:MAG: hypothetical protein DMF74_08925 [Acidobacteriota bacterium]